MKVEVAVLGSPFLKYTRMELTIRAQELYESRGGRPGFPVSKVYTSLRHVQASTSTREVSKVDVDH